MRIAMLASLWKSIPPQQYGGTELVTSLLTEELVRMGHDVTLFACGGSKTSANLVEVIDKPLMETLGFFRDDAVEFQDFQEIKLAFDAARSGEFDIIHNHMISFGTPALSDFCPIPMITTTHCSRPPSYEPLAKLAKDANYVSISNSQRQLAPYLNYVTTIYHGIDTDKIGFNLQPDNYLLFLATISADKGVDRAIEIAKKSNQQLLIVGNISDQDYFDSIKSQIDGEQIIYLGEAYREEKYNLMKNAKAYLFPIRWSEAFGMTIIESLASGTPVIAFRNGSLPEIIDEGKTGFLVNSIDEAIDSIGKIGNISREECRRQAVERFDVAIMAKNYEKLYEQLINNHQNKN